MCRFFSGVVTYKHKAVVTDLDQDSHEYLLEKAGLKDDKIEPNFVRVELLPKDGDIFNHDLSNWKLSIDQDKIPEWFDKSIAEKMMQQRILEVFKKRFAINKVRVIKEGRWFIGRGAQVRHIYGSAQVRHIYGSAQVGQICDSAQVEHIYGSAQVGQICDSAQVRHIYGSAQVGQICGSAQVENICGSAQVENIYGRSVCCFTEATAKYKAIKENGVAILYYKDNPEIVVANKEIGIRYA